MTRYIQRLNRVEAIRNNGEYVDKVIPFLNENGIPFEYRDLFTESKNISIGVGDKMLTLNIGDYIVAGSAGVTTMSPEDFKREFEEDIDLNKRIADLEGNLSKVMTDMELLSAKSSKQLESRISSGLFKANEVGKVINV